MDSNFQEWAYIELMGHNKIAGFATEIKLGKDSMLRVDVPEVGVLPKFSKVFNLSAVYAITPVSEQTAIDLAQKIQAKPLDVWDMESIFKAKMNELIKKGSLARIEQPIDDDF